MSIVLNKFNPCYGRILNFHEGMEQVKKNSRLFLIHNPLGIKDPTSTGALSNLYWKIEELERVSPPILWPCRITMEECEQLTSLVSIPAELLLDSKTSQLDQMLKSLMKMERRKTKF